MRTFGVESLSRVLWQKNVEKLNLVRVRQNECFVLKITKAVFVEDKYVDNVDN